MHLDEKEVVEFFTELFENGSSYTAINTARSALSTILCNDQGLTIGKYNSVKRFLKGVFELRPPMPRYQCIWDANIVLEFLKNWFPYEDLPLSHLTHKVVMLLALSSAQRAQTLHVINVNNVSFADDLVEIPIFKLLKQTTARNRKFLIRLKPFKDQPSLCVIKCLRAYIEKTKVLRGNEEQLLISFVKPHKPVTTQTISRWLKLVLQKAGIDVKFKAHSTRAASVSKSKQNNVNIDEILKKAGWSNDKTFKRFYDKIIV